MVTFPVQEVEQVQRKVIDSLYSPLQSNNYVIWEFLTHTQIIFLTHFYLTSDPTSLVLLVETSHSGVSYQANR